MWCDSVIIRANAACLPLKGESVQCVVTSPPYWGLRSYGTPPAIWGGEAECNHEWGERLVSREAGYEPGAKLRWAHDRKRADERPQGRRAGWLRREFDLGCFCARCGAWRGELGMEPSLDLYAEHLAAVMREIWRVLRPDGTVWLNLGDTYTSGGRQTHGSRIGSTQRTNRGTADDRARPPTPDGLKAKDLCGVPWRIALALQGFATLQFSRLRRWAETIRTARLTGDWASVAALEHEMALCAGPEHPCWYVRNDIIWFKLNGFPESVKDRCTRSHEHILLLTKLERYCYDADAVREPYAPDSMERATRGRSRVHKWCDGGPGGQTIATDLSQSCSSPLGRNCRDVWMMATEPTSEMHFAVFPEALAARCILAGSRPGDLVLDPFLGSGTTARVAERLGRRWVGVELADNYLGIARRRTAQCGLPLGRAVRLAQDVAPDCGAVSGNG